MPLEHPVSLEQPLQDLDLRVGHLGSGLPSLVFAARFFLDKVPKRPSKIKNFRTKWKAARIAPNAEATTAQKATSVTVSLPPAFVMIREMVKTQDEMKTRLAAVKIKEATSLSLVAQYNC